jgi:aminoglycoside phosphotransferase (APT) family kinase protein
VNPQAGVGAKLGEGREADVYAYGSAVLKLYRPGFGGHATESQTLRCLDGHGVAPKLVNVVEWDGRIGLVVERVAGTDMLALLQRQPWRVFAYGRQLAQIHRAVHDIQAPAGLVDLREVLAGRIRDADAPRQLLDYALWTLDGLPDGDRLCHGDYHPGNVLIAPDRAAVIDWGAAARGAPDADHARTLLLLRWSHPLPGTPVLSRALIAAGRSLLARAYVRTYGRGLQSMQTRRWLAVHAAARLSEGIVAERPMLINRLARAWRAASATTP